MDTTNPTQDEDLNTQPTGENTTQPAEQPKTDLPKVLRDQLKKQADENKKLQAKLDAIEQAEADKTKTAEEKKAELELKIKEYEEKMAKTETYFTLEKKLLTENINPELSDLINPKAKELLNTNSSIDEVVEMLKSSYPTAFSLTGNKPIAGKVGVSATTSNTTQTSYTPEQINKIIKSGNADEIAKINLQ